MDFGRRVTGGTGLGCRPAVIFPSRTPYDPDRRLGAIAESIRHSTIQQPAAISGEMSSLVRARREEHRGHNDPSHRHTGGRTMATLCTHIGTLFLGTAFCALVFLS